MPEHPTNAAGHRLTPAGGPRLRTDVIDVYVYQRAVRAPENLTTSARRTGPSMDSDAGAASKREAIYFLQLLRSGPPLAGTWHPVMGHIEAGETAAECAWRELREELGLFPQDPYLLHVHALEQVHPFFIAELDAIVLSPRFVCEVRSGWSPRLNDEHTEFRWIEASEAARYFTWPGQLAACREIVDHIAAADSLMRPLVRLRGVDSSAAG